MSEPVSKRTSLLAGIFVLCGLILLGGLILEFGPLQHRMRKPYTLNATFADAQNLLKGAPVRRSGAIIGKVASAPELDGMNGVRVTLDIYPEYKIHRSSLLRVVPVGLMGDSALDIGPPADAADQRFFVEGDTVAGSGAPDLTSAASRITDEAVVVMKDIRGSLTQINETLTKVKSGLLSDQNLAHLGATMEHLDSMSRKLDETVLGQENVTALKESLKGMRTTMDAAAGAAMKADKVLVKADSAVTKVDKAMDALYPGLKGFQSATASLSRAADALESIMKLAQRGNGLLGALLNDPVLKENFNRLIANLRAKGLLWYKDKAPEPASRSSSR